MKVPWDHAMEGTLGRHHGGRADCRLDGLDQAWPGHDRLGQAWAGYARLGFARPRQAKSGPS